MLTSSSVWGSSCLQNISEYIWFCGRHVNQVYRNDQFQNEHLFGLHKWFLEGIGILSQNWFPKHAWDSKTPPSDTSERYQGDGVLNLVLQYQSSWAGICPIFTKKILPKEISLQENICSGPTSLSGVGGYHHLWSLNWPQTRSVAQDKGTNWQPEKKRNWRIPAIQVDDFW